MNAGRMIGGCVAVIVCLLFAGASFAQDGNPAEDHAAHTNEKQGVPVFSGGVGDDEMNYIKNVEHQYNLKLFFTETNGVFLSDLPVTISDRQGRTVVNTVTKGPILLVNLPVGSYSVSVADGAQNLQQKLSVPNHGLRVYQFRFAGSDPRSPE